MNEIKTCHFLIFIVDNFKMSHAVDISLKQFLATLAHPMVYVLSNEYVRLVFGIKNLLRLLISSTKKWVGKFFSRLKIKFN